MRMFAMFFLCVTSSIAFCAGPCAATPQDALRAYVEGSAGDAGVGFRVVQMRTDVLLGVNWADVKRCDHPEWPGLSLATHRVAPKVIGMRMVAPSVVAVRAGERVRVWRHEANARLEMVAVSDEGGAVGDRIRLHVASVDGEPVRYYFGLVRGPSNVEME